MKKKTIVLFGSTRGLGAELIKYLNSEFKCIAVGSKNCDVTDEKQVESFLKSIHYDVVIYLAVNNVDSQIHKQTNENLIKQLDVNIFGFLNILRYCTPKFRNQKFGRIIYVSSILAKKPIKGTGVYSASKSFCEKIIETYSLENSKYGITANTLQLGYFDSGLIKTVPKDILSKIVDTTPLKRLGRPDELLSIIKTIIDTEFINGSIIPINGGL